MFLLASTTSGSTGVLGCPAIRCAFASCELGFARTWSAPEVWAWLPSQNSVEPVVGLKGQSGMLAITKKGHCGVVRERGEGE